MNLLKELKHHIPFTLSAAIIAVIIVIILYLSKFSMSETAFEILHPMHLFVSAIVTSALFYLYKPKIFQALLVGISGSIIIGSLSDIIFPYLGGLILNINPTIHLPLIESPILILSMSALGSIVGISTKITKMPHFIHILLSVFASLFYLLAFSQFSIIKFIGIFVIVFVAVIIPCCISDIIYPMLFIKNQNINKNQK